MHDIHTHLSILARSVQHKNLSSAATHVGLSQPQLSRIIAKLEEELKVVLLDRGVRRKSSWTPVALKLAEMFLKSENELQTSIQKIVEKPMFSMVKFGTLEGLSQIGIEYCQKLFKNTSLEQIQLDIFEISELEEKFQAGELDFIFSFRIPGRQKYKNVVELGYQSVDPIRRGDNYLVYSPYELIKKQSDLRAKNKINKIINEKNKEGLKDKPKNVSAQKIKQKVFISNSLELRRFWIENIGGIGKLPSKVNEKQSEGTKAVFLVGSDLLSPLIWNEVVK